ncbi:formate dehydrogenase accessory sulfurtransferase FdhD [Chloroflexota bacterium]
MMDSVDKFPIERVTEAGRKHVEDLVIKELPLTITLNNRELLTLLCSPADLEYLAVGFLFSEGLLQSKEEIEKITVDTQSGAAHVKRKDGTESVDESVSGWPVAKGCGGGTSFHSATDIKGQVRVSSPTTISPAEVFGLMREFLSRSQIHKETGGVHGAALCDSKEMLLFTSDIGRHNAIDKIFGECILRDIPIENRIIITSGRVSSEILLKVAKRGIPILISKSAPTDLGVRLANDLGVTLIGFVRGERMNIYANGWRVTTADK